MEYFKDFKIEITNEKLFNNKVADVDLSLTFGYRDVLKGDVYIELYNGDKKTFSGEHSTDDYELDYGFTLNVK
jgi:hypothetical protein